MHWIDLVYSETVHFKFSNDEKARIARGGVVAVSGIGLQRYLAIRDTLAVDEMLKGMHQAAKMIGVMSGNLSPADDAEVAEAFNTARRFMLADESASGAAAGILKRDHLGQRIDLIINGGRKA
jgi:hypothetical protein